jgi:hypothetical protein
LPTSSRPTVASSYTKPTLAPPLSGVKRNERYLGGRRSRGGSRSESCRPVGLWCPQRAPRGGRLLDGKVDCSLVPRASGPANYSTAPPFLFVRAKRCRTRHDFAHAIPLCVATRQARMPPKVARAKARQERARADGSSREAHTRRGRSTPPREPCSMCAYQFRCSGCHRLIHPNMLVLLGSRSPGQMEPEVGFEPTTFRLRVGP